MRTRPQLAALTILALAIVAIALAAQPEGVADDCANHPGLASGIDGARPLGVQEAGCGDPLAPMRREEVVSVADSDTHACPLLRVVDDVTGDPVCNVDVFAVAFPGQDSVNLFAWHEGHEEAHALFQRLGSALRANADGLVFGPKPNSAMVYWSEHQGRVGQVCAPLDAPLPVLLRLESVCALSVRVVDAAGLPADDVRVVVRVTHHGGFAEDMVTAKTEPDGRATLNHVPRSLFQPDNPLAPCVTVAAPVAEPPSLPLAGLDLMAGPSAMLRLPPTGTFAFKVIGAPGVDDDVVVALSVKSSREALGGTRIPAVVRVLRAPSREVLVRHVGVGVVLDTQAECAASHRIERAVFEGPRQQGETATAIVDFGDPNRRLTAILSSDSGAWITNALVSVELQGHLLRGSTDARGHLAIPLPSAIADAPTRVTFHHHADGIDLTAEVALAGHGGAAMHCGAVRLGASPPQYSGRVVDATGQSVAGVLLELTLADQGVVQGCSGPDGSFALRAPASTASTGLLRPLDARYASTPAVQIPHACSDAVLVLEEGCLIVGGARPRELATHPCLAWLVCSMPADGVLPSFQSTAFREATVDATGGFRCAGLAAGSYTVVIAVRGDRLPVLRVDGVIAGMPEPRLAAVDLEPILVASRLQLRDSRGMASPGFRLHRLFEGMPAGDRLESRFSDMLVLSHCDRRLAVVATEGAQPRLIELSAGSQEVCLEACRRLTLRWDTHDATELTCVWTAVDRGPPRDVRRFADPARVVLRPRLPTVLLLPGNGTYQVTTDIGTASVTVNEANMEITLSKQVDGLNVVVQ